MATPDVRLVPGAVFWRTAITVFLLRQLLVLATVAMRVPPRFRLRVFLFGRWATLRSLLVAVLVAVVVTLLSELLVRLVVGPAVRLWLSPRTDHSEGLFRLSASEHVLDASPARRRAGWFWRPGTLVRTNRRVWFFPNAWDAEMWSIAPGNLPLAQLEPVSPRVSRVFQGFPERLVVRDEAGEDVVFAVLDPQATLPWFRPRLAAEPASPRS